ncbi:hypothetical protein SEPCBS119000_005315 [Sporothrix epigloea]|uniref:Potassium transport protein n=1 Tax=Sporothrix epigloea TaxID=1892477 RepID=A0ABP0DZ53_9PEZI
MANPAAGVCGGIRKFLPPLNFITIHYTYFLVVISISSLIFWGSSKPGFSISYTDSLFLVVSAMTESGLNTVNLSQMTTWQQIILFLLIVFGGSIWVSIWTVVFRKHVLEKRLHDITDGSCFRDQSLPDVAEGAHCMPRGSLNGRFSPNSRKISCFTGEKQLPARQNCPSVPLAEIADSVMPHRRLSRDASTALKLDGSPSSTGEQISTNRSRQITFGERSAALVSTGAQAQAERMPMWRAQVACGPVASQAGDPKSGKASSRPAAPGSFAFLPQHTIGRNAQFHGLTREERERLGGCEYRALKLLVVVVPLYFFLWQLLGCIALGSWINGHMSSVATDNGINPWWLGIFNGASAFNNSGMSLLDANMVPFGSAYFVIITMGLMILAGNTAYPVFLRLIFWTLLKVFRWCTTDGQCLEFKETLAFILQYPRRVYTNLFPSRPTWWLLFMIVFLNCIDWLAFELLNLGNPVVGKIPTGSRILDGLFQAIAVRSGGFYIVPIANVYIGLQVLYVIMMYISVYPVVITMRHSNVYEERSLGIYHDDPYIVSKLGGTSTEAASTSRSPFYDLGNTIRRAFVPWHGVGVASYSSTVGGPESRISFISQQIHGQLAHDLWWLVLAVLIIVTIETSHFIADPISFSIFNIIFEVVSAYGCVGISVGIPSASYSFSGGWHNASKIVLCLVMMRGRHRGLPVALDRAVRLPGENLHRDEEEDHRIRCSLSNLRLDVDDGLPV